MNPLFLGTSARRLFGIHEPAAGGAGRSRGAVLCHPWGSEYTYAHRSMRQLAGRLAAGGIDTLRFDYFGTGDSGGDESDTDAAGLQADVATAIEALKDIAQVSKVTLIGLRAGANVAARTAIGSPADFDSLILWDPLLTSQDRAEGMPPFDLDFPLDALPSRSLLLGTRGVAGNTPTPVEFLPAPCPWVEMATITGALPVPVLQRIQQWLR